MNNIEKLTSRLRSGVSTASIEIASRRARTGDPAVGVSIVYSSLATFRVANGISSALSLVTAQNEEETNISSLKSLLT